MEKKKADLPEVLAFSEDKSHGKKQKIEKEKGGQRSKKKKKKKPPQKGLEASISPFSSCRKERERVKFYQIGMCMRKREREIREVKRGFLFLRVSILGS